MLTSYMDVNFNKYSNVSFLTFVYTVFISIKNHIQVLNGSSNAGAALVKTITSLLIAPAGFWPSPRRHPRVPGVYVYTYKRNIKKVLKKCFGSMGIFSI